jgi:hypothetical protein
MPQARVQMRGRGPGGSGLGGVLLGLPQLSDRAGQSGQARDEQGSCRGAVTGDLPGQGDQPGSTAQPPPVPGDMRDPAIRCAGGPVITTGGAAQLGTAQRLRRDVQRIGRRPRRIRAGGRITGGGPADVLRGRTGLPGRMLEDRAAFRGR